MITIYNLYLTLYLSCNMCLDIPLWAVLALTDTGKSWNKLLLTRPWKLNYPWCQNQRKLVTVSQISFLWSWVSPRIDYRYFGGDNVAYFVSVAPLQFWCLWNLPCIFQCYSGGCLIDKWDFFFITNTCRTISTQIMTSLHFLLCLSFLHTCHLKKKRKMYCSIRLLLFIWPSGGDVKVRLLDWLRSDLCTGN